MKSLRVEIFAGLLLAAINGGPLARAQPAGTGITVTADNFVRAETDRTFASFSET